MAKTSLIESMFATGEEVSLWSMHWNLENPFDTNLSFYFKGYPSVSNFVLKAHLQFTNFWSGGRLTISHVSFLWSELNSCFMIAFHVVSSESYSYDFGSDSIII